MLLAHSAKLKKNIPAQSYADHISGVVSHAVRAADTAASYATINADLLRKIVRLAAEFHDLGKLDEENQNVLSGIKSANKLPIQHTDAGTAYLLNINNPPCAVLARSHHIGLPDFVEESNRPEENLLRDDSVRDHVNSTLEHLLECHRSLIHNLPSDNDLIGNLSEGNAQIFFRIALSCLVDGDHTDTAIHYKNYPRKENSCELRAEERLSALDQFVAKLGKDNDERSSLRAEMYRTCRNSVIDKGVSSCDSPVGTGKTTAIMAHMLTQAKKRGLRRIIVVLPFTNIITQSVEVYRKALVLPGENPEEVVAELHHRAAFQDVQSRHLTALWKAPIIVTTAVTFFETLASNTPSTLRRLHNLPGSAVFIDESHAALPAKLLPLAWHWIKGFADEWKCYWVLASGSLNRFWQIPEFDKDPPDVPEILSNDLRRKLSAFETERVFYKYKKEQQGVDELVEWLASLPGPRIVILNTVQSAAVAAREYAKKFGRGTVEHLSTALTPQDRKCVLKRVKSRLANPHYEKENDWVLIATSCVEAGVDISFRTGVRELSSLVSLLQTAGRVKRHGGNQDSDVWLIRLSCEGLLKPHPGVKDAAQVLKEYCEKGTTLSPKLCTDALKREIRLAGNFLGKLQEEENIMCFPKVEKEFRVIDTDTRLAVVDEQLIIRLEKHEPVNWHEMQQGSVQIWGYKLEALGIQEIREGIYKWDYPYDEFLGYMAGVLPVAESELFGGAII